MIQEILKTSFFYLPFFLLFTTMLAQAETHFRIFEGESAKNQKVGTKVNKTTVIDCDNKIFTSKVAQGQEPKHIGGKAYNLLRLENIERVPPWFCISASVFENLVLKNESLQKRISTLQSEYEKKSDTVFREAQRTREAIMELSIPIEMEELIRKNMMRIAKEQKGFAVRSSAKIEDGERFSCAGLFDSFLNVSNFPEAINALKKVWASCFNDAAIEYFLHNKLPFESLSMSVVFQRMVQGKASGTAFNIDVSTGFHCYHIAADHGSGGIVDGENGGDSYLLLPDSFHIIKKTETDKNIPSLKEEDVRKIAVRLKRCAAEYKKHGTEYVDTEFVLSEDNELYFVQIRPLAKSACASVATVDDAKLTPILKGLYSVTGAATGKAKIIKDFNALPSGEASIGPEDIVVAHRIANYWGPYLTKFAAVVTEEGAPTSHPMLICRERNIPCVIGVRNAVEILSEFEGRPITVDGIKKAVYLGKAPFKKGDIDNKAALQIVPVETLPDEEPIIKELLKSKRLIRRENAFWLASPNCILSAPLRDLQMESYKNIKAILNDIDPLKAENFSGRLKIIDGKIYHALQKTLQEDIVFFEDMSLEDCERYGLKFQNALESFASLAHSFEPNKESWEQCKEAYKETLAYMWLSFAFRTHVNLQASIAANQAKIPQCYYEEFCNRIQDAERQEDKNLFFEQRQILQILQRYFKEGEIPALDIQKIKEERPLIYEKVKDLSLQYKFKQSDDFYEFPDLQTVFDSVKNANACTPSQQPFLDSEYFTDNPFLKRWIELSIKAKIMQNNAHHVKVRGLWNIRKKLIDFSSANLHQEIIDDPLDILKLPLENIESLFEKGALHEI